MWFIKDCVIKEAVRAASFTLTPPDDDAALMTHLLVDAWYVTYVGSRGVECLQEPGNSSGSVQTLIFFPAMVVFMYGLNHIYCGPSLPPCNRDRDQILGYLSLIVVMYG